MRVLIFSEGRHEMGTWQRGDEHSCKESLPALPQLVLRLLSRDDVSLVCERFHDVRAEKGKGNRWGRKVKAAIRHATAHHFDAAVIVVDRDGDDDSEKQIPMRRVKDEFNSDSTLSSCAVGTPVETFDTWMIVDSEAIEKAGGDKSKACHSPETLEHPKDRADEIFCTVGGTGLGPKYQIVAQYADLELLTSKCPQGFAPFAADVKAIRE